MMMMTVADDDDDLHYQRRIKLYHIIQGLLLTPVGGHPIFISELANRLFDECSVKNATTSNYFSVCKSLSSVQFEPRRVDNKSSHHNSI